MLLGKLPPSGAPSAPPVAMLCICRVSAAFSPITDEGLPSVHQNKTSQQKHLSQPLMVVHERAQRLRLICRWGSTTDKNNGLTDPDSTIVKMWIQQIPATYMDYNSHDTL